MASTLGTVGLPSASGTRRATRLLAPPSITRGRNNRQTCHTGLVDLVIGILEFLFELGKVGPSFVYLFLQSSDLCLRVCGTCKAFGGV